MNTYRIIIVIERWEDGEPNSDFEASFEHIDTFHDLETAIDHADWLHTQ